MATVTATIDPAVGTGDGSVKTVTWTTLGNGDSGSPVKYGEWADRSFQITGTFGSGGTIVIEGSNDGTNYVTLTDPQGNDLSFTAAGMKAAMEITEFQRPRVTAGDGTTDLDVTLFMRRPSGMRT